MDIINHNKVVLLHIEEDVEKDDGDINLLHTITMNFLENPKDHLATTEEILNNLSCHI